MNGRSHLGPAGFVCLIILCAGSIGFAQVDWTFQGPVVGPGDPGSWDSSRHQLGDTVHGWGTNCYQVHHLTAPLEVVFFDGLEGGDIAFWSAAVR